MRAPPWWAQRAQPARRSWARHHDARVRDGAIHRGDSHRQRKHAQLHIQPGRAAQRGRGAGGGAGDGGELCATQVGPHVARCAKGGRHMVPGQPPQARGPGTQGKSCGSGSWAAARRLLLLSSPGPGGKQCVLTAAVRGSALLLSPAGTVAQPEAWPLRQMGSTAATRSELWRSGVLSDRRSAADQPRARQVPAATMPRELAICTPEPSEQTALTYSWPLDCTYIDQSGPLGGLWGPTAAPDGPHRQWGIPLGTLCSRPQPFRACRANVQRPEGATSCA